MSYLGHSGETEAHVGKGPYVTSLFRIGQPGTRSWYEASSLNPCFCLLRVKSSLGPPPPIPPQSSVGLSLAHSNKTRGVLPGPF